MAGKGNPWGKSPGASGNGGSGDGADSGGDSGTIRAATRMVAKAERAAVRAIRGFRQPAARTKPKVHVVRPVSRIFSRIAVRKGPVAQVAVAAADPVSVCPNGRMAKAGCR